MQKKIIVPVDFSPASRNAFNYAREMAREFDASLELVHVYNSSFSTLEPPVLMPAQGMDEVMQDQLNKFAQLDSGDEKGDTLTGLQIKTRLLVGSTVETLKHISEEKDCYMIIMGATGKHDAMNKLFGSISSLTAQKAACPVMLIPENAVYREFENVLYASNFESADGEMVSNLKELADMFRASVHFIHVDKKDDKEDYFETGNRIIDQLFKESDPGFSFYMDSVKADSVLSGLNEYAAKHKIDLMVIVNRQRNFMDSILGNSMTKQIALRPKLPVLVYHLSN